MIPNCLYSSLVLNMIQFRKTEFYKSELTEFFERGMLLVRRARRRVKDTDTFELTALREEAQTKLFLVLANAK